MTQSPSSFIWYELMTSDPVAAAKFYGDVVGWSTEDSGQSDKAYCQFKMGEAFVGGMLQIEPAAAEMGIKPVWLGYVNVADLTAALSKLKAAGGQVHMPPTEVPGVGSFAMVSDPQGAMFYIMTPIGEGPSPSYNPDVPGHGAWHELHTSDWEAAFAFYAGQFGWGKVDAMDMGPMGTYLLFNTGGSGGALGGMMTDADSPRPMWSYYIRVADIDAAALRVTAARGQILFGPSAVPGGGWIINALDPQGAMFSLTGPRLT